MTASLWVTLIIGIMSPICTLLGVIIVNKKTTKKQSDDNKTQNTETKNEIKQEIKGYKDLTLYRIDQLERKVELHNNAVERLFIAEGAIKELQHEMVDTKTEMREMKYGEK